ncbi:hypothetical protein E6B08_23775 [Pseudomonas putida]|uniref:Uncharacterized protein n=1 Tax=Pseudomonas putida TaxID=303 RepID=A0A4D6XF31_PSEPU|nr:hypothetical protein [Pseudomonas putida]QCI14174.1 hypothetical protein E6B08_23775 [Pseudomonas putida]
MIKLTVSRTDNNDDESNLPSRFFPSAGLGHGWFQLDPAGEELPTHDELGWALQKWDDDCLLKEYDSATGKGQFVIVDWYAPAPGSVIELRLERDMNLVELPADDGE